ncbi:ribosome biosynthesis protein nip7 [Glugoides intestinalis]
MRILKADEEEKVMNKLKFYIGDNINDLLKEYELRLNNQRVFLITKTLLKACSQLGRDQIVSCGVILGKITKTENFRIKITAMHVLHKFAIHKVWIKTSAEMNFLYGNNALKSHIHKVSESIPLNAAVFVYDSKEVPLGFGVMAVNSTSYSNARGGDAIVLTQADNGEYIRNENNIV